MPSKKYLDNNGLSYFWGKVKDEVESVHSNIYYGVCDGTSTSIAFTATIDGITEYTEGLTIILKNGVVTSAAGFTININNLGAKPVYHNMAAATAETTIFNINYTLMLIYENRVSGGNWLCYRGYDSNTNTIGYQLRTNSSTLPASVKTYRYRLLFTSADGTKFVPANADTSTSADTIKTPITTPIDPFGEIVYYGTTSAVNANANFGAAYLWQQYTVNLGYSFNNSNAALTLTYPAPVYVKATPQSNGSVIIDATNPYVQELPSAEDGKIYIYLGLAYSATNIELRMNHPVYHYKDGAIRLWSIVAEAEDDEEILNLLTEYGYSAPIADADGNVVTDTDNNIILG